MPRCCPPAPSPAPYDSPEEEIAALAKALGHPVRVQILRILLEREECLCGEIVDELPLAQSTVSQHLKVLREAGLIHGEIDGRRTCYCVSEERLERLEALLGSLCAVGTPFSGDAP
ncbi:MAG: metalloregulator ArsR/SmtB family transcription factor [Gemmatimonadetes bacterium]|nr:metalloregulator ArsR/SmtB family transcription factor [Gemmatimonadota bacterium]